MEKTHNLSEASRDYVSGVNPRVSTPPSTAFGRCSSMSLKTPPKLLACRQYHSLPSQGSVPFFVDGQQLRKVKEDTLARPKDLVKRVQHSCGSVELCSPLKYEANTLFLNESPETCAELQPSECCRHPQHLVLTGTGSSHLLSKTFFPVETLKDSSDPLLVIRSNASKPIVI
uniref:Uncharacterized protein n=1 Tax=Tetraselmis sp. GSL018 TaxID=582737 RepID=A0A061RNC3_9CHLO